MNYIHVVKCETQCGDQFYKFGCLQNDLASSGHSGHGRWIREHDQRKAAWAELWLDCGWSPADSFWQHQLTELFAAYGYTGMKVWWLSALWDKLVCNEFFLAERFPSSFRAFEMQKILILHKFLVLHNAQPFAKSKI